MSFDAAQRAESKTSIFKTWKAYSAKLPNPKKNQILYIHL